MGLACKKKAVRLALYWALAALAWFPSSASAASYYLDCTGGNDGNAGTSPQTAWKGLAKANGTTFQPGDSLLLMAGCQWTGTLSPGGIGAAGNAIKIDKYGTGPLPRVDGAGAPAALTLKGQEFWEISNLDLMNAAATPGLRTGVHIIATGVSHHVHLTGLNVHQISGQLGADLASKATGGIGFESQGRDARFDDILVENCSISHADSVGIFTSSSQDTHPRAADWALAQWTNVVIRGNQLLDIGKNGIIVRSSNAPLIESNVINGAAARLHGNAMFVFGCLDAVMQFNEVYNTSYSGLEGAATDPDYNCLGTIVQYNYSHDNGGGLVNPNNAPGAYNDNITIRYNVSQNDTGKVIAFSGATTNTKIYNNTIYVGATLSPAIIDFHQFGGAGGFADKTSFTNNIIYNAGTGASYAFGAATNVSFDSNCFFGGHPAGEPADPNKISTDPLFASAGTGGLGRSTLAGYLLRSASPCAASGAVIADNGGRDFFGNPLPSGKPDRGAAQGRSLPGPLAGDAGASTSDDAGSLPDAAGGGAGGGETSNGGDAAAASGGRGATTGGGGSGGSRAGQPSASSSNGGCAVGGSTPAGDPSIGLFVLWLGLVLCRHSVRSPTSAISRSESSIR